MRVTSLTWLCHTGRLATSVLYPTAACATAQNVFFNFGRTAAGFGPLARGCHQRRLWLSNGDRIALQSGHCRVAAADPRTEGCRAGLRLIFRGGMQTEGDVWSRAVYDEADLGTNAVVWHPRLDCRLASVTNLKLVGGGYSRRVARILNSASFTKRAASLIVAKDLS